MCYKEAYVQKREVISGKSHQVHANGVKTASNLELLRCISELPLTSGLIESTVRQGEMLIYICNSLKWEHIRIVNITISIEPHIINGQLWAIFNCALIFPNKLTIYVNIRFYLLNMLVSILSLKHRLNHCCS